MGEYENVLKALAEVLGGIAGQGKIVIVDENGNVISDVKLSDIKALLSGAGKIAIVDGSGNIVSDEKLSRIFSEMDAILGKCQDIYSVNTDISSNVFLLAQALKSKNIDSILTTIKGSEIQVPADLQSILNYVEQQYGLDLTVAQSITLDKGGYRTVEVIGKATAATTFKVEYSFDNTHWYTYYESGVPETNYNDIIETAARYIRLSSSAAGAAGDTVDLVIAAVP